MKKWVVCASILGALAVMAGAFGAHSLRERLEPQQVAAWGTAASYQLLHSAVILGLGLFALASERSVSVPAWLFTAGIVLFSGSIYLLTLGWGRFLGPVTPLGGLCFIAAWLSLPLLVRQ